MSLEGLGLDTSSADRLASMTSLKTAFPIFLASCGWLEAVCYNSFNSSTQCGLHKCHTHTGMKNPHKGSTTRPYKDFITKILVWPRVLRFQGRLMSKTGFWSSGPPFPGGFQNIQCRSTLPGWLRARWDLRREYNTSSLRFSSFFSALKKMMYLSFCLS